MKYILRARDINGNATVYTGKAGSEWISPNEKDAFAYFSQEEARRKAMIHNRMTPIHGLHFLAVLLPA